MSYITKNELHLDLKNETHGTLNSYSSGKDANGIYTAVEYKRADGTLYMKSTLSNPTASGFYQRVVWDYYNAAGTTVLETKTWTLTYDVDGIATSRVVS